MHPTPAWGSGHILCYLFDMLMQIYESQGYSQRDAAQSIVQHNLYGLDIDKRATQLAYFSAMMKARQYDRRFFSSKLQPMVYSTTGDEDGEKLRLPAHGGRSGGNAGGPAVGV